MVSDAELFAAARAVMANAHAPYSGFPVGAAVLTADGIVHTGCNVENASFPEGWCAETSALGRMVSAGDWTAPILAVAVTATKMDRITPCGGCRQRLAEFGNAETRVILCDQNGPVETVALKDLLPHAFDGKVL
ncbi:MAG: cytidine deaminase [Pseudomonadota bacterium]